MYDTLTNQLIYAFPFVLFEHSTLDQWYIKLDNYLHFIKSYYNKQIYQTDYIYQKTILPSSCSSIKIESIVNPIQLTESNQIDEMDNEMDHQLLAFYYCFYSNINNIHSTVESIRNKMLVESGEISFCFIDSNSIYETIRFYSILYASNPYELQKKWNELKEQLKK